MLSFVIKWKQLRWFEKEKRNGYSCVRMKIRVSKSDWFLNVAALTSNKSDSCEIESETDASSCRWCDKLFSFLSH